MSNQKRNWQTLEFLREVYISSDGHYHFEVWLEGIGGKLRLEYDGGYWLYANRKDFSLFTAPKYVEAMVPNAFAKRYNANEFTFYEYRNYGDGKLWKDTDPRSLRYHDAEMWEWIAKRMMKKEGNP